MKDAASFQINLGIVRGDTTRLRVVRHFFDIPKGALTTKHNLEKLMEGSPKFGVEWGSLRAQTDRAKVALQTLMEERLGGITFVCRAARQMPTKKTKAEQLDDMSWGPETVSVAQDPLPPILNSLQKLLVPLSGPFFWSAASDGQPGGVSGRGSKNF